MPDNNNQNDPAGVVPPTAKMPRTILSRDLLGSERFVIIRHDKDDYRLQITASGKLILTK